MLEIYVYYYHHISAVKIAYSADHGLKKEKQAKKKK